MKSLPPLEILTRLLSYDPATGFFINLKSGRIVGKGLKGRYTRIYFRGREYQANRLGWYLYYGRPPTEGYIIDHLNGEPSDNRIENLRELNQAQNIKSGKKGTRFFIDGRVI